MDYDDCNGNVICQPISINVVRVTDDNPIESIDWVFPGPSLSRNFYDVKGFLYPDNSKAYAVNTKLTAPQSIAGNNYMHYGDSTRLTVVGGYLSKGATWKWYKAGCDKIPVWFGKSIVVSPESNEVYFVKGQSSSDQTNCVSIAIDIDEKSKPAMLIIKKRLLCSGDKRIQLSVLDGRLEKNAEWVWYMNGCSGFKMGTGQTITVLPIQTTTYYARAEGKSNTTPCVSIIVNPNENINSVSP